MSTACPNCNSGDTTIWSKDSGRVGQSMRTRYCQDCRTYFRTIEVTAQDLPLMVNDNGRIRQCRPGTPISSIRLLIPYSLTP